MIKHKLINIYDYIIDLRIWLSYINKANVYQYVRYIRNNHLFLLPALMIMFNKVIVVMKDMLQQYFLRFDGLPIESM